MSYEEKLEIIKDDFKNCQNVLTAIGDETRHLIIVSLIDAGCGGMRVGEITQKTHLSRPAVSHHLKILKDAEVIKVNRVGTMNYYFLELETRLTLLKKLIEDIEEWYSKVKNYRRI